MPSFKTVFFALATLSATVFASPVDTNDIFENPLAKRNMSPADSSDLEKRAPWGWRRDNIGSKCRFNASCRTSQKLGKAFCNKARRCDFRCQGHSVRQGNKCVGARQPPKCKFNSQCPRTTVKNANSACGSNGRCTFRCAHGFHAEGNKCVKNAHLCGGKSCPSVGNGYAICKNGKWIPQCHFYLGFSLYHNKGKYTCVNTNNDVNHCGRHMRKCKPGYNGLGKPVCSHGKCGLDCKGFKTRTMRNGHKYCSKL